MNWLIWMNAVGLVLLSGVVFLLVRQVGILFGRLGPTGARSSEDLSPRKGENLRYYMRRVKVPTSESRQPQILLLLSTNCYVCKNIRSSAFELARHWGRKMDITLVYEEGGDQMPATMPAGLSIIHSSPLRVELGIGFVPFAIRLDANGTVIDRGLVNEASHVESLMELPEPKPRVQREGDSDEVQAVAAPPN
jgi:hypothetical protein